MKNNENMSKHYRKVQNFQKVSFKTHIEGLEIKKKKKKKPLKSKAHLKTESTRNNHQRIITLYIIQSAKQKIKF